MTVKLDIAGDLRRWLVQDTVTAADVDLYMRHRRPLSVVVSQPVLGRLLLNTRAAQAVVVTPTDPTNWMPSHLAPTGKIHLLGAGPASSYALASDVDQDDLELEILDAFAEAKRVQVALADGAGTLVIPGRSALGVVLERTSLPAPPSPQP